MIEAIKSLFIFKKIFSFIKERRKLLLFSYNKRIQNKLNIKIMDYLCVSKVYKMAEKNGKGKEYLGYNKNLIFEGEYKNGKRNGIGTNYYYNYNII